jgi:hypothetical protein
VQGDRGGGGREHDQGDGRNDELMHGEAPPDRLIDVSLAPHYPANAGEPCDPRHTEFRGSFTSELDIAGLPPAAPARPGRRSIEFHKNEAVHQVLMFVVTPRPVVVFWHDKAARKGS